MLLCLLSKSTGLTHYVGACEVICQDFTDPSHSRAPTAGADRAEAQKERENSLEGAAEEAQAFEFLRDCSSCL